MCYVLNNILSGGLGMDLSVYALLGGPLVEEIVKSVFILYLIRARKIGFMVDASIHGFAIGAGFSAVENIYYVSTAPAANIFLWIIRGFGTAVMHGAATAVFAIMTKNLYDRTASFGFRVILPGLLLAVAAHSLFNRFFLGPLITTLVLLVLLPLLVYVVFTRSERLTREWLGMGFDTDARLLEMILTGQLSETNVGKYLKTVKDLFPAEVVFDLLCLLRLQLELAIRAKGILLMREAGFDVSSDPGVKEKFEELRFLEKSVGKTGLRAISPFLRTGTRDLWQLTMLEQH
jgi:hypothetical protein